jgi:uncharacterized protein (DUF2336 family)
LVCLIREEILKGDMASNVVSAPAATVSIIPTITLIAELERVIANASVQRRVEILTHIADLFVSGSARFVKEDIELFDDLFTRLVLVIESAAKSALAERLARVANAPFNVVRMLASDNDIKVAHPILAHSLQLDDATLVLSARTKSQAHLLAISQRQSVSEAVTDVLVERGNKPVVHCLAGNPGAKFSEGGFALLVNCSANDDTLAIAIGSRADVPPHILSNLLEMASEMVQMKFTAENVRREFSIFEPRFSFFGNEAPLLVV